MRSTHFVSPPPSVVARLRRSPLLFIVAVLGATSLPSAQSQYTFTKIADTVDNDPGLAGVACVALGNDGTVLVAFTPTGASANGFGQVWKKRDGETFTQVAPDVPSCPSINDLGDVAYMTVNRSTSGCTIVRNNSGATTEIASSTVAPGLDCSSNNFYAPLSNNGNVPHVTFGFTSAAGIYVKPAGFWVYNPPTDPPLHFFVGPAAINDSDTVPFLGSRPDSTEPDLARIGIYRGSGVPFI